MLKALRALRPGPGTYCAAVSSAAQPSADIRIVNCLRCGKDIGNALGSCADCREGQWEGAASQAMREGLSPQRGAVSEMSRPSAPTFVAYGVSLLLVLLAAAVFLQSEYFYYWLKGIPQRTGDKDSFLELTLGRPFTYSGVVFDAGEMPEQLQKAGFGAPLLLMEKGAYNEFGRRFTNSGACPTPYLKEHLTNVTPISNEAFLKVPREKLKGKTIQLSGYRAKINSGVLGNLPFSMGSGAETVVFVSNVTLGAD